MSVTIAAIRAGDYYLFEEGVEMSLERGSEVQDPVPSSLTYGQHDDPEADKRLGPLQVVLESF